MEKTRVIAKMKKRVKKCRRDKMNCVCLCLVQSEQAAIQTLDARGNIIKFVLFHA